MWRRSSASKEICGLGIGICIVLHGSGSAGLVESGRSGRSVATLGIREFKTIRDLLQVKGRAARFSRIEFLT
jgi:hypothetical protein